MPNIALASTSPSASFQLLECINSKIEQSGDTLCLHIFAAAGDAFDGRKLIGNLHLFKLIQVFRLFLIVQRGSYQGTVLSR